MVGGNRRRQFRPAILEGHDEDVFNGIVIGVK